MAKYKAYPEYKDSEIEWLGKIPSGWLLKKAKYIFQRVQRPLRDIDGVVTAFRDGQVTLRTNRRTDGFTNSVKEIGYQGVRRNDLVIHAMDGFAGAIGVSDSDGKCSPVCSVCIPWESQSVNMHFYGYLVRQLAVTDFILSLAKGIRERSTEFRFSEFSGLMLAIPPIYEQNQIATFLDYETAKIDNLIEKQQQLIELLKEKRQAVISHAVTKGLNPDVPMKDSGVEWLGDVPKHWKCGYLRWYISVSSGTYLNNKDFETDESNDCINPVIGGNGVMGFTSKINDGNCLVVGRVGALCGNVHQIRRACWVTDNALKITYGCDFDVDYLEMYLKVLDLNKLANHNAQPLITGTMIKEQVAIIPSIDEQKNITKFIQSKVGKIDLLIQKSSEAVDKIKERRTALISAAVTGKIDVRDWVAPDTQGVEESQEATV
ncbi:TPA: restriction endonuclease subunit S [Citrobacter koseri]|uniref:restriction endonuclease subunit S n=1 Tax=Citrobacter koseri TaxID=545 RepID=UPI002B0BADC5|nr:restriction endonuclease subunit S [Citrobacter koseri]